ncbi:hypothetical protein C5O26_21625 [Bacillus velezensis]|nr:hypothetical protein C5O26_21625 [Bacillus velezensis]
MKIKQRFYKDKSKLNMEVKKMRYKAKVKAVAEMEVWVHEDAAGNIEIEYVEYVDEIEDFENVRPMDGR